MSDNKWKPSPAHCKMCGGAKYLPSLVKQLEKINETLCAQLEMAKEALEELNEFTATHLEDMEHYFDNKCVPTKDEVNTCAIADSMLRYARAKLEELKKSDKEGAE